MGVITYGLGGVDAIAQGANWNATVTVYSGTSTGAKKNLTGYTVAMKLKQHYDSSTADVTVTCTLSNATGGVVALALTATQTAALTARRYVYDLAITSSGGTVTRITQGAAYVSPKVT